MAKNHHLDVYDVYSYYEIGLNRLLSQQDQSSDDYYRTLTYQQRMLENLAITREHGDTDRLRSERAAIIHQLNLICLQVLDKPFINLCNFPQPSQALPKILQTEKQKDLADIQHRLNQHQRNLQSLVSILQTYGEDQPIHLRNSYAFEQENIKKLKWQLELLQNMEKGPTRGYFSSLHNIPRRPFFVGREEELHTILFSLSPNSRTFIVAIEGLGGVGKSALAIEVAHRCLEQNLFSAIIWISAKKSILTQLGIQDISPELQTLRDLFTVLGQILGQPTIGNASFLEQRRIALKLLSEQTTLLVIDNFESLSDQEQQKIIAFLRQTPVTVKALVTLRLRISEGHTIRLQGLSAVFIVSAKNINLMTINVKNNNHLILVVKMKKYTDAELSQLITHDRENKLA